MLNLPAPPTVCGDELQAELVAAELPCERVLLVGDTLDLYGLEESHRAAATSIVEAHEPAPQPTPIDVHAAVHADPALAQETKDALCSVLCPEA